MLLRCAISLQVDAFCRSQPGLRVVGYYHANELLTDLDLKPVARKLADRIQQQQGIAVTLLVRPCMQRAYTRCSMQAAVHAITLMTWRGVVWLSHST